MKGIFFRFVNQTQEGKNVKPEKTLEGVIENCGCCCGSSKKDGKNGDKTEKP